MAAASGAGIATTTAFVMIVFHLNILLAFPMGVPLEWNVFMIFGVLWLFVAHALLGLSDLANPLPVAILFTVIAGTVVIANGASDVVRWHCDRSQAGLLYDDDFELEQCLRFVADAPETAAAIASAGRPYVLENYSWSAVLDRVEASLQAWLPVTETQCAS